MKKFIYLITVFGFALFSSCEDEELNKLAIDAYTDGAVLSTQEVISTDIDKGNPSASQISVIVSFRDFVNNDSMEEVNVYVEFADTTPVDNEVVVLPEAFLKTIAASDFTADPTSGLPTATITVTGEEAITSVGVDPAILDGGDIFIVRYELVLKDGRIFTSTNVGEDVAVTSHNTPFRYSGTVVCLAPAPLPNTLVGGWVLEGQDSYGDGWNGATVDVIVDGVTTSYGMADGDSVVHLIEIPPGANEFSWVYISGAWDSEVTFQIYAPSGNIVGDYGPGPTAGPIPINLCNEL